MQSILTAIFGFYLIVFIFFPINPEIIPSENNSRIIKTSYHHQDIIVEPVNTQIKYIYGKELTINTTLEVKTNQKNDTYPSVKEFILFLQSPNKKEPFRIKIAAQPKDNPKQFEVLYKHNFSDYPLPLFSTINYWFGMIYNDNQLVVSKSFSFVYEDNRFTWKSIEANNLKIFWYEGDGLPAQDIYHTVLESIRLTQEYIIITLPTRLQVFLYPSKQDLQIALSYGSIKNFQDIPFSNLDAIILYTSNDIIEQQEINHQLSRQLSHFFLRYRLKEKYPILPLWLKEGFAALINPNPLPENRDLLMQAFHRNTLIPIDGLCRSFPKDSSGYALAEAESISFTRYLIQNHGNKVIEKLVQASYQEDDCILSFENAVSIPLRQMEIRWQKDTFSKIQATQKEQSYFSWSLIFMLLLCIPIFHGIIIRIYDNPSRPY